MAVVRDRLSTARGQARRGRHLDRPAHARRRQRRPGNRAQTQRLRHFRPARVAPFALVRICRRQGDRDHSRGQGKGEDVHFYPLLLTPTPKIALELVRDKNLRPRDGKPFSDYSLNDRYRHMSDAADEIAQIAAEMAARKGTPTQPPSTPSAARAPKNKNQSDDKIEVILGAEAPFATVEPAGVNMRSIVRVRLRNNSTVGVANCKLDIANLDPPNKGKSECALKTDIVIGPKSDQFVDVASYDIGSSQGLPSRHIRLVVPRVGGFFAEAYAYADLPLLRHTFHLRLSRFSEVHDEKFCALYLDTQGVLRLESDDG